MRTGERFSQTVYKLDRWTTLDQLYIYKIYCYILAVAIKTPRVRHIEYIEVQMLWWEAVHHYIPYTTSFNTVIHVKSFQNKTLYAEWSKKWSEPYHFQQRSFLAQNMSMYHSFHFLSIKHKKIRQTDG